jgi:hypothetical protein
VPLPAVAVTTTSTAPAACAGVVAVMVVELVTDTLVAAVPPNVTEVAPVKCVPVMVTAVPPLVEPVLGETEVTATRGAALADREWKAAENKETIAIIASVAIRRPPNIYSPDSQPIVVSSDRKAAGNLKVQSGTHSMILKIFV